MNFNVFFKAFLEEEEEEEDLDFKN